MKRLSHDGYISQELPGYLRNKDILYYEGQT